MVHLGLATATKTPELMITDGEAKLLAKPLADILEELNLKPDPRLEKAFALIVAAASVYGPRVVMIQSRLKGERARSSGSGSTVTRPAATAPAAPQAPAPAPVMGGPKLTATDMAILAADQLQRSMN